MKKKRMDARKLPSRTGAYSKIIEILVPTRFYWDEDGEFDGIEFGPFDRPVSRYQIGLIYEALDVISELMGVDLEIHDLPKHKRKTPMPDAVLRAFKKDTEDKEVL